MDLSNYIIKIDTMKVAPFKTLIEALKDIFKDVNIKFIKKKIVEEEYNEKGELVKLKEPKRIGGISIMALNINASIFVKLYLPYYNFEEFHCEPLNEKDYVMLSVNMTNFNRIIKNLNTNEKLTIFYEKNNLDQLGLIYTNPVNNSSTTYEFYLLDLPIENFSIEQQNFKFIINMPSLDFHTLIKNMSNIAEQVDIKFIDMGSDGYEIIFHCSGDIANQTTRFRGRSSDKPCERVNESDNSVVVIKLNKEEEENKINIIQGLYDIKSLSLFSKCATLCTNIELYMNNNCPLVIKYMIANLGYVYLILSSINNKQQFEDNYEEDEDS